MTTMVFNVSKLYCLMYFTFHICTLKMIITKNSNNILHVHNKPFIKQYTPVSKCVRTNQEKQEMIPNNRDASRRALYFLLHSHILPL